MMSAERLAQIEEYLAALNRRLCPDDVQASRYIDDVEDLLDENTRLRVRLTYLESGIRSLVEELKP